MKNNHPPLMVSIVIYILAALIGFTLVLLATWADVEASLYGFNHTGGGRLSTLSCPILMTANETSSFSIKVTNTTDNTLSPTIKTDISTPFTFLSSFDPIKLAPGESKRMEWAIGPGNIELGHFIFVRGYLFAAYPLSDRENTCGIFIVNLPSNGITITWGMIALSLLGMGIGLYGLRQSPSRMRSGTDFTGFVVLSITLLTGIVFTFLGWWLFAGISIVITLLLFVTLLGLMLRPQ